MADIPIAPISRIIKSSGAHRISHDALVLVAEHLEKQCSLVGETCADLCAHAGRKTITDNDVKLAIKTLYE